jgi:hypothetical protein
VGAVVIAVPASDTWVLSGGPTAGSMPLTFLQSQQPSDVCRLTDLTQSYFVADAGAATAVNMFILGYTNATQAATWRIRGATSAVNLTNGSAGYDSRVAGVDLTFTSAPSWWDRPHGYLWLGSNVQTFRYWRVDVFDAANSSTYFQAGRLYAGNMYQASRGAKLGGSISVDEVVPTSSSSSAHLTAGGGQKYPSVRIKSGRIVFSLEFLPQSEALVALYQIVRRRGGTKDVWVVIDPDDSVNFTTQQCYGTLKVGIKFQWTTLSAVTGKALLTQDFECEELP